MGEVVNFKQFGSVAALNWTFGQEWLYIGRANGRCGLAASPLANPYRVGDYGGQQGAALQDYQRWLWERIRAGDEAVLAALRGIGPETVLVCWCKPESCHGDVLRQAAAWVRWWQGGGRR